MDRQGYAVMRSLWKAALLGRGASLTGTENLKVVVSRGLSMAWSLPSPLLCHLAVQWKSTSSKGNMHDLL